MLNLRIFRGSLAVTLLAMACSPGAAELPVRPDPPARPGLLKVVDKAGDKAGDKSLVTVGKDSARPAGTPESDALVKEADELRKHGDYQAALRKVHEALQKVPRHPQGLLLAGTLEGATNQPDQAIIHLKQALALMPDNLFVRKVYSTVLLQKHNTAEALEVLGPVLQVKPLDSQAYVMAAQISAASADFDQAGKYLAQVFAVDPGNAPGHELAARIAFTRHQPEEARKQLEALLKARPDDVAAMIALANLDVAGGRNGDAAAMLERARKAQPEQPEPLIASSEFALQGGKTDEAAGYIGRLARMIPDSVAYLSLKGQLAMAQGHPKDAVEPLQAALAKQPIPEVMVQLHQAMSASGQQAEADKRLNDWIASHPEDARMRFYAAESAARRSDFAGASAQYRKILDKDPDNPVALNDLAQSLQAQHDPKALEFAEKAYRIKPDSPVTENTLGGILMANGQSARGLGLLRDAADHAPQNPEVRFDYARALASSGDKAKAKAELEALLALKRPFRSESAARDMLKGLSGS